MSEMISGVAGQILQQTQENQAQKQPENTAKRSFDSYLQQEQTVQGGQTEKQPQTTSGVEMQTKLEEMQAELAKRFGQTPSDNKKINSMLPELLDSKTRLGLLKEAYSKIGKTGKVTSNLSGRFIQVEGEYRDVEALMTSDKKLSPGELLALQARLYQVSQHIEVMSKVVDQMAGGIKTVLNTNV